MLAKTAESQVNDTLRYLQGLFNADKFKHELKLTEEMIPHEQMLQEVKRQVDGVLDRSKYNKVDLRELFSFMGGVRAQ